MTDRTLTHSTESRKAEHVKLAATGDVGHREKRSGFDDVELEHNALPELALADVDTSSSILGHPLSAPLIISSMTGGYGDAYEINRSLARSAEKFGLAIGVGSQRQALQSDEHHRTFAVVREAAPTAFIIANIGGVELAKLHAHANTKALRSLMGLVHANALAVHLNPLQELMQPEGDRDFRGVRDAIRWAVAEAGVPVIVKEVGAGISAQVAKALLELGVRAVDVAGAGGTSWAGIEILRGDPDHRDDLEPFWDWGIPTAECIKLVTPLKLQHAFDLVASGGVRNGLDVAKSIALGADLAGVARPFIQALMSGGEPALERTIDSILHQLRIAMLLTGSRTLGELHSARLLHS